MQNKKAQYLWFHITGAFQTATVHIYRYEFYFIQITGLRSTKNKAFTRRESEKTLSWVSHPILKQLFYLYLKYIFNQKDIFYL